jgi:hypothetical protein
MRILQTSLVLKGEGQKDPGYRVDDQADGPCFFPDIREGWRRVIKGKRVHEKEITLGYKLIKREDVRVKEKGVGVGRSF